MFIHSFRIFTLNKFDIKVDPSWLIIAALVTWSLSRQYFPSVLPDRTPSLYLTLAVIAMAGLFASLLLHELSHSVVARRLGVPINSITLFLFGGVAEMETEPPSANVEFWIAIAGPAMSFALAIGFWSLVQISALAGAAPPFLALLSYLALINLVLGLFNLVPAFPLDGGRLLRAYIWQRNGDLLAATRAAAFSGTLFAYLLMGVGVMTLFQGDMASGLWFLMIGSFVLIAARASYASQLTQTVFKGKTVAALMSSPPVTASPEMTLAALVNQIMLSRSVTFVPVMDGDVLLGHIDQSVLSRMEREHWANTRVGDVFIGLEAEAMVAPDMTVPELLDIIRNTGRRKFLVVRDHTLLGVITLSDLTRYLSLSGLTGTQGL